MQMAGYNVTESLDHEGLEVFTVPGPDLLRDKLFPLNADGCGQIAARLGTFPARASLSRWRIGGYPIDRSGPRVRLPYTVRLKKVYTSTEALTRWFQVIQALGEEIRQSGGVSPWRTRRRKTHGQYDRDGNRIHPAAESVSADQRGQG